VSNRAASDRPNTDKLLPAPLRQPIEVARCAEDGQVVGVKHGIALVVKVVAGAKPLPAPFAAAVGPQQYQFFDGGAV
jgi:hypothetical protein